MTEQQAMNQLYIGDPPKLPSKIAAQVAWSSIKVRMSRSLVTVSSVVLAVTFLLVVLGGELASFAVYSQWSADIRPAADALTVRTHLEKPRQRLALLDALARDPAATLAWAEDLGHGFETPPAFAAERSLILAHWLEDLKPSQRYLVVRTTTVGEWVLALDDPQEVADLVALAADFKGTRLPMPPELLSELATAMPTLAAAVEAMRAAERARLVRVQEAGGPGAIIAGLVADTDPQVLADQGLPLDQILGDVDADRIAAMRAQFRIDALRAKAQAVLSRPRLVTDPDSGEESAVPPISLGAFADGALADHPLGAEITDELEAAVSADELARIIDDIAERRTNDDLRATFTGMNYDPEEGREKTFWLVILSLLVCVVGIVNSMMMAVTERFREIATMKCLGAMDGFILKAFMIESGSVGTVGALLGAVVGLILVFLQSTIRFGGSFWSSIPIGNLFLAAVAALGCGMVLTVMGALLPAYRAARMHPIEAMRLEA